MSAKNSRSVLQIFRHTDILKIVGGVANAFKRTDEAGFSQYRLAVESGVPHATLSGLLTGKTKIERCESGTLYKLAKTLGVSMEILVEDGIRRTERKIV